MPGSENIINYANTIKCHITNAKNLLQETNFSGEVKDLGNLEFSEGYRIRLSNIREDLSEEYRILKGDVDDHVDLSGVDINEYLLQQAQKNPSPDKQVNSEEILLWQAVDNLGRARSCFDIVYDQISRLIKGGEEVSAKKVIVEEGNNNPANVESSDSEGISELKQFFYEEEIKLGSEFIKIALGREDRDILKTVLDMCGTKTIQKFLKEGGERSVCNADDQFQDVFWIRLEIIQKNIIKLCSSTII